MLSGLRRQLSLSKSIEDTGRISQDLESPTTPIMQKKVIPSFKYTSDPEGDHEDDKGQRKSRSLFRLVRRKSSNERSASGNRSPSPYAGRSSARRSSVSGRSPSTERETGNPSDVDVDSDSDTEYISSRGAAGSAAAAQDRKGVFPAHAYYDTASESEPDLSESDNDHREGELYEDEDELEEEDPTLLANTEANAGKHSATEYLLNDPSLLTTADNLDGPNLVKLPPSPFAIQPSSTRSSNPTSAQSSSSTSTSAGRGIVKRRKSTLKPEVGLQSTRPIYERNRCTITLTHGDPDHHLEHLAANGSKRPRQRKTYVVASDLSEESYYAIEWAIGTVLRNGDELLFVTVLETDSKLDPDDNSSYDRVAKIRNQQERQTRVLQLSREATALLERTRLHVRVHCQAIHAKNARHMLVDLIDYVQPVLVIIGSRGLSKLKGIILGSVSHYLIQKSSSPVMVTRRRLKPLTRPRRPISDLQRQPRVGGLENATIDKESHAAMVPSHHEGGTSPPSGTAKLPHNDSATQVAKTASTEDLSRN